MDFGKALNLLKEGHRVAREGWNGKGMWICLVPGIEGAGPDHLFGPQIAVAIKKGSKGVTICPRIDMLAADGSIVVGWLASQTDMLAEDWVQVE